MDAEFAKLYVEAEQERVVNQTRETQENGAYLNLVGYALNKLQEMSQKDEKEAF